MSGKKDRGYVRVSTQKDSQKDSPEHQEAFIRERAKAMGIEIDHIYLDKDSATSIVARDDVQRMINDAKRGEIRSLFFASLSRFSRDALDAISLKRILVNALKIRVVSLEDGYDSGIKDDELVFGIKSVVNQNTSGDISVSSRRGIHQSAAKGNYTGSIPPYGYKKVLVNGRKTLEVIPEQAEIVKTIFDMYTSGTYGEKTIVNFLNGDNGESEAVPSYKGGVWGISSIQRILQNENYTGYTVFGRHTTEVSYNDLSDLMDRGKKLVQKPKSEWNRTEFQTHEAIITREIYEEANAIRLVRGGGTRGGRRTFVNVFAKLIFCSDCGSAMISMASKMKAGTNEQYRYLMCSRRRRTGAAGCPNGRWIPYYDFRDELISGIINKAQESITLLKDSSSIEHLMPAAFPDSEKEKKKLAKRVEDNRKLLFEIRRQNMLGDIDESQYEFEKTQYEKEIVDAEKRLSEIETREGKRIDVQKTLKQMNSALEELISLKDYSDVDKTRMIISRLVDRIEVNADGKVYVHNSLM